MVIFKRFFLASLMLLLLSVMSCSHEKSPLDDFQNLKSHILTGEEIHLQNDSVLYVPYNFKVYDSLGVFNDNTGQTAVTLVNLKNGGVLKKIIFSGDKPSEFDINAISINSVVNDKSDFTVLQMNPPCKIIRYNWARVLDTPSYKPKPIYYTNKFGYSNSFLLNDSTLFGQLSYSKFDNKLFAITNITSNKLITGIDLPRIDDKSFDNYYHDSVYYSMLKSSLDIKVRVRPGSNYEFAYFSSNGALMQIFDLDKDYNFKVKYEKVYYLPLFAVVHKAGTTRSKSLPKSKRGFNDVTVTNKKIYTLFSGSNRGGAVFSDDVLVYDWQGRALEKIKLDRKCRHIAIDENNPNLLYGLYGNADVHIVKYRLQ